MNWHVRRMTLHDYLPVKQLWVACGLRDEPEDGREGVAELLSAPQSAGFVADEKGEIQGAVLCGNDGRYGYIHHLAVSAQKRSRGVGRSLVQACTEFLSTRHVIVMVKEDNQVGKDFWSRLCFQRANGLTIHYLETMIQHDK